MFDQKTTSEQTKDIQEKAICPFVYFGTGPETIVIFPPINDSIFDLEDIGRHFRWMFRTFLNHYTFYVIGRKRNLPLAYSTQDMAQDYAETFKTLSLNDVHLIGISLGGMVSQLFAHQYPGLVRRLIIIGSAHHMGPEGLKIARRWIPWAREGKWKEVAEDTLHITFHGSYLFWFKLFKPLLIRYYLRRLKSSADFIISGQAGILHDSSEILSSIRVPVLILGGTEDRFFPESLFHEMSKTIPKCELLLIEGARHGVLEQYKKKCLKKILNFLSNH